MAKKRNTASTYGGRPGDGPGGIQGSDLRTTSRAKPKTKPTPTPTPRPKANVGTPKTKPKAKPAVGLDDKRAARNAANAKRKPKVGVDDQKAARNAANAKPKAAKFTRKGMNASKPASALRKANAGMRNKNSAKTSIKNMLSGMDKGKKKPRKVY